VTTKLSLIDRAYATQHDVDSVNSLWNKSSFRWEDPVQHSVDKDASDESVHPIKIVEIRGALQDMNLFWPTDGERQTRQGRASGEDESQQRLPVDAVPVSVSSIRVIQSGYVDVAALDEPVVGGDDTSHWCKKDRVASHKG